jgi:hypothetical protein
MPAVLPNAWLSVSAESQRWAQVRLPQLAATPAVVRFASCEPLLGAINIRPRLGRWSGLGDRWWGVRSEGAADASGLGPIAPRPVPRRVPALAIARRRAERPSEEYRDLTAREWEDFLAHFELRKVALGTCGRDHGTPCAHENACVRCPLLRVDPAQKPRLEEIHANLIDRLHEAKEQGWLGEVAAIETSIAAAAQKLATMRNLAADHTTAHLGMPTLHRTVGRSTPPLDTQKPSNIRS